MANTDGKIVLGLDVPKTVKQINADIKKVQKQLAQVKAAGALDTSSTVKKLNSQIAALQSQLKAVDINMEIDTDRINKAAQQIGTDIAQTIADGISQSSDKVNAEVQKLAEQAEKNNTHKSLFQSLSEGWKKAISWIDAAAVVTKAIMTARQAVSTVSDLDAALADLRKTADMSARELIAFYHSANDTAKQMGVTTQSIIDQAAAWSRLGFRTADAAAEMAKYSSMFAAISPGMDPDFATDGLVSVMKAFKIGLEDTDEVVDGIMSKINIIGNTQAVDNRDIVNFLTRSSSAMAEANNTLEDTIALGTAMIEITGEADGAGQVLNAISMRIRGYDEETEEFIGNVEGLAGTIADLTKTASTPNGIRLFSDDTEAEYKSTRQLLQEISEIYDQLTAKDQSALSETLAGKGNGQAVTAILNNFDTVTASLESMADSAGNAEAEMSFVMDSIDYKLNKVKETGTGIAQNLFAREDMKSILDIISSLGSGLDWLTERLGLLKSIGIGASAIASAKGLGLTNYVTTNS